MARVLDEISKEREHEDTTRLLAAELADIMTRLHTEAEVPQSGAPAGDFLDVAQGVEHQELARLSASRLVDRARRLSLALARVSEGEYGVCSECGASIPPKRLLAVPDATTCVACQSKLEHVGVGAGSRHDPER